MEGRQINGQGTQTFPNGNKYVGQFKDDELNGQGTSTFTDGSKYVGGFVDIRVCGARHIMRCRRIDYFVREYGLMENL